MMRYGAVAASSGLLAAVGSVLVSPLAAEPAQAAPAHLISCQSMQSETDSATSPVLVSGCRRLRVTGGSGVSYGEGPGPYPVTWNTGKRFDFNATNSFLRSPSRCPESLAELDFVGVIVSSSGPWTKPFIGDTVAFDVCITHSLGTVELLPGTVFSIG